MGGSSANTVSNVVGGVPARERPGFLEDGGWVIVLATPVAVPIDSIGEVAEALAARLGVDALAGLGAVALAVVAFVVAVFVVAGFVVAGFVVAGFVVAGFVVAGFVVAGSVVADLGPADLGAADLGPGDFGVVDFGAVDLDMAGFGGFDLDGAASTTAAALFVTRRTFGAAVGGAGGAIAGTARSILRLAAPKLATTSVTVSPIAITSLALRGAGSAIKRSGT